MEHVNAPTPSDAVRLRSGGRASRLPHTITDLTALSDWMAGRVSRAEANIHTTPMLDRMWGPVQ